MNLLGDAFKKSGLVKEDENKAKNGSNINMANDRNTHRQTNNSFVNKLKINPVSDYDPISEAQKLINKMAESNEKKFTTTQLRKVFAHIISTKNSIDIEESKNENDEYKISKELQNEIQYIRLKLIYQMGKENTVKKWFGSESGIGLDDIIANIDDDKLRFDKLFRLLEGIIAYKKYYIQEKN